MRLFIVLFITLILSNKLLPNDESDREYVIAVLRQVILDNIMFETEWDAINFAEYKSRSIVEKNDLISVDIRNKLYLKLIEDIDLYQRLHEKSRELVFKQLMKMDESSITPFHHMSYRDRVSAVQIAFSDAYKLYLLIDIDKGSIIEIKSQIDVTRDLTILENYAIMILDNAR